MARSGMTLIETIVVIALVLIIITVSMSCLVPAYQNYQKSQEQSALISNVQLALKALTSEFRQSDVSYAVIVPSTYTHPQTGKTCFSYTLIFASIVGQDGTYAWDADGNPLWRQKGIFYHDSASGNLYFQQNFFSPTATATRPAATFTPRHTNGPDRDRLIARNIGSFFLTDSTQAAGVTTPAGDYIKVSLTGMSGSQEFPMEASIYARKTR